MSVTWGPLTPREWQQEALPLAIRSLRSESRGLIRAATGSGKSVLQAEIVKQIIHEVEPHQFILVTAPTQKLVRQLSSTIAARNPGRVGRFFQSEKRTDLPVIVACHASIGQLKLAIQKKGKEPYCWIADECHKTESAQVLGFNDGIDVNKIIGFTATPFRRSEKERLSLFDDLIYDYGPQRAIKDGVIVPPRVVGYDGTSEDIDEVCGDWIFANKHIGPGIANAWDCDDAIAFAAYLNRRGLRAAPIHSKLKTKEQNAAIKQLEEGAIDVLVHVNMLTEGVDLPWLRWLCMRRASEATRGANSLRVISRVRFIQEVGRIVRAFPGKKEALIFDPNDLFGTLALDYDALLGETEEDETDNQTEHVAQMVMRNVDLGGDIEDQRIQVIENRSPIQQYVRQVALTLRLLGFSALKSKGTKWRHYPMTDRQRQMAKRYMADVTPYVDAMPPHHRSCLRAACLAYKQGELNQGDMFDLNTIMTAMIKHQGWPLPLDDSDNTNTERIAA